MRSSCCSPGRDPGVNLSHPNVNNEARSVPSAATGSRVSDLSADPIRLAGGPFRMGSEEKDVNPGDGEGPIRPVVVSPFAISATTVTNAEFAKFVSATSYLTEAESFGWSYVFASFLPRSLRATSPRVEHTPWWCAVDGARWKEPEGPGSVLDGRTDHPVVHVSWGDAESYARWIGGRLPTEAEWEYAARGGLEGSRFAWGEQLTPDGEYRCNIWQGTFPTKNTVEDGYRGTAPVKAFLPNGFGLYNTAGNVWEMCADWWGTVHPSGEAVDPRGPVAGTERVMRGGSYLCHASYCNRYRVAARTKNTPDSTSGNQGFRLAYG